MSKKVSPTAIGLFVTGAIVILLTGLVLLGSGKFFEKRGQFVVYLQGNVNGLDEGSEVVLAGVKVGQVVKLQVQFDPQTKEKVIPVIIELSADRLAALSAGKSYSREEVISPDAMNKLINEDGLRARLMSKSALTGQLYVDLDFFVEEIESYTFPGETFEGLTQIPSTKNQIQQVLESIADGVKKLSDLDINELATSIQGLVDNVNARVTDLDVKGVSDKANETLEKADAAITKLDKVLGDERIPDTIADINETAKHLKELVGALDPKSVNEMVVGAGDTIESADVALKQASETLKEIKLAVTNVAGSADPEGALLVRLNRALTGIEEVSRSVKDLTDYLKRNPNSIFAGKK